MNVRARFVAIGLCVLVAPGLAEAQFNAQLQGTVTDQTGGVLPRATVVLRNTATGVELTTVADNDGGFRFPNLAPGGYQLKVELSGFRTATVEATVLTQQTSNVKVTLEVATATEQVSVVGKPVGIDVADSRVHATYGEEALRDLPFQGRNFLGLMAVAPGVTGKGAIGGGAPGDAPDNFSTEKTVDVSANGRNSGGNQFIMDGLNTTSNIIQGVANLSPNPDAIQEMAIQTNTFSVAEGRASSVNVAITTKSGTNGVRGTGSYIFTNQDFLARPFFRTTAFDPFYKHDMSGTIGGPIVQNRTFFFASVQPLFSRLTNADSVRTYESPEFVAWARQNFPNSLGTRVLTEHGMKNVVTTGVLRTARDVFGDQCGTVAARNIPCDLPMVAEGRFKPSPFRNGLQWNTRIDHYLNGGRDRVYGNYFRTTLDAEIVAVRDGYDTSNKNVSDAIQTNWTRTLSPNLVNEFAFGWLRVEGNGGTDPALPMSVPNINIGFQSTGLSPTWGPATFIQNNYNWKNVVTWVKGAHLLKFGFQAWYGDDDARFSPVRSRPTFDFNNLLELVTDDPREQRDVAYDPLTGQTASGGYRHLMSTFGAYVQDDWKVKPNLTLTLGLRWDDYGDIRPDRDKTISFANIFPGSGSDDERFANASVRSVDSIYGRRLNKNFSPRAGFAWDPSNEAKWMIRGGVGLYKDWIPLGEANRVTGNPPGLAFPVFRRGESPAPIFSLGASNSYPFGFVLPKLPSREINEAGGLVGTRVNVGGINRDILPTNTLIHSLGFERQLPFSLVGGATYNGSRTWDGIIGTDFNRVPGDLVTDGTLNRLNPNFAQMYFEFNGNKVWYNGLIFTLRRNLSRRTSFQSSYTLSKVEDYGQAGTRINRDGPFQLVSQNHYRQYKAAADHDRRHRFSFAGTWHLTSASGRGGLKGALLDGWMVAGIGIFESGPPINVVNRAAFQATRDANGRFIAYLPNSGDYNGDGFNYDYPNRPSQDFTGSHSRDEYVAGIFTAADFPRPEAGTLGDLPRFFYRGPGFAQVDLGFIKGLPLPVVGSRGGLQFRVDLFNIFNRVNLANVNGDLNSATFGRSTGTFQPRVVQFGVRVSY